MSKLIVFFYSIALLVSCSNGLQEKNAELEQENKRLQTQLITTQENSERLAQIIHSVHTNLARIEASKQKVNKILSRGEGRKGESKALVLREMQLVNSLQEMNKNKIATLNLEYDSLIESNLNISKVVAELENSKKFEEKTVDIVRERLIGLNYEVELLNQTLDSISFMSEINSGVIELQEADLKTAYYCIGNFKTLSAQNIIEKKGGVAGLGSVPVILKDFDKSKFTTVDVSLIQEIELTTVKVELLSTHPSSSFKILDNGKQKVISIINPEQFWGTTHYLIVLEKR